MQHIQTPDIAGTINLLVDAVNGLQDEIAALHCAKADVYGVPSFAAFTELREEVATTKAKVEAIPEGFGPPTGTGRDSLTERVAKLSAHMDDMPAATEFGRMSAMMNRLGDMVAAVTADTHRTTVTDFANLRAEVAAATALAERAPTTAVLDSLREELAEFRVRLHEAPSPDTLAMTKVFAECEVYGRTQNTEFEEYTSWSLVPPFGDAVLVAEALVAGGAGYEEGDELGTVDLALKLSLHQGGEELASTQQAVGGRGSFSHVVPLVLGHTLHSRGECWVRLRYCAWAHGDVVWVNKAQLKTSWHFSAVEARSS